MDLGLHFSSKEQTWETPQWFFNKLNEEFKFTLDPCCTPDTAKCQKFYTPYDDGLSKSWEGEIVFCNPPYNEVKKWVKKCHAEGKRTTVVMLIPAKTDTRHFHEYILGQSEIRFVKGRLVFGGSLKGRAPFPSMVVIFKPTNP